MNLNELMLKNLGIDKERFGRIFSFVDFGNVNYWYEDDERDWQNNILKPTQKLIVDIEKLAQFLDLFSEQKRFYYGLDPRKKSAWHINIKAESSGFIKVTKPIQFIRHYLKSENPETKNPSVHRDFKGNFIEIPKCNFDVEISVDSIRLAHKNRFDTFCLLSGDSDFAVLAEFLKKNGKKIIIIASGPVFHTLKDAANLYINAQKIKGNIARLKETPPR